MSIASEDRSLKVKALYASGWTLFGQFSVLLLRLVSTLILTRLFDPKTFGILAIALAVQMVIWLLLDIGLRPAIIQSPNGAKERFLNTAWTLQIVRGVVVWLVGAISSLGLLVIVRAGILPPESTYANDQLPAIITGTSFSAVILGFQSMKLITFGRDLKLQRPTLIELVSQIANLAAVILVGWVSKSIWAFVFGSLFGALVSTLLSHLWLPGPRDQFAWDREALKELARFGKWVFFSSVISSLAINGDRLLLAGWLSPAEVGYYSIAANLVAVPDTIAMKVFGSVVLPALSDVLRRQPARLGELYARMRLVTDSCLIGLSGFLFSASPWIIGLMYDARYEPSGIVLQYLSISLIFARYSIFQSLFLALGHPNYLVVLNCFRTMSLFILVPAAYYLFGPTGAIVGVAIHMLPSVIATLWLSTRVGTSNLILEVALLGIWPLGWTIGYGFVAIARQVGL